MFYADKGEIYDGEWSNDQRMGKGHIINRQGEIVFGDFRSDFMDGKQTYLRTLAKSETDKIFKLIGRVLSSSSSKQVSSFSI